MRPGRLSLLALLSFGVLALCSTGAWAQAIEPAVTNGGCLRLVSGEGASASATTVTGWTSFLSGGGQIQLSLMAARWLAPVRQQPVLGQQAMVPTRSSVVRRKKG
jgi:hypothetical protein